MRRGALSTSQVLEEEYEYVSGKKARCAEGERDCWRIRAHEIIDPHGLFYRAISDDPSPRFKLLKMPKTVTSDDALREAIAHQMNSLLGDAALAGKLLADPKLAEPLLAQPERCALLLEIPECRSALFATPWFIEALFDEQHAEKRIAIADELDGAAELRKIIDDAGFRAVIRKYPAFLGVLIDDLGLRELLATNSDARKRVRGWFAPPKPKANRADPGAAVSVRPEPAAVAADRSALLAIARGKEPVLDVRVVEPHGQPVANVRGNALLLETAFGEWIGENRAVTAILRRMHAEKIPAICLSGGGIRSATFNLGVLQALARRGVLSKFKYISTVSGGGYIGAWLSSWMRRHEQGAEGALADLAARTGDPIDPEPQPLRHLRDYSRYLAPRAGIFTVDLWTIVAIYVRNLLLNWTLLLPPLLMLLLVPRGVMRLLMKDPYVSVDQWLIGSFILLVLAMCIFAEARPKVQVERGQPKAVDELRKERRRTQWKLLPIILSALLISLGIGWHLAALRDPSQGSSEWQTSLVDPLGRAILFANLAGALVYVIRYVQQRRHYDDRRLNRVYSPSWQTASTVFASWRRIALEFIGAGTAAFAARGMLLAIEPLSQQNTGLIGAELFVCFSIPLMLLVFVIEGAVLLGITTVAASEHEREWVARAASGVILVALGWILVTGTALFVPIALYQSPTILATLGGISGVAALVTGRSARTAANVTTRETTNAGRSFSFLIGTAATVCLIVIGGAMSLAATEIVKRPVVAGGDAARAARVTINTVVVPDGASDYTVRLSTNKPTSIWTLAPPAWQHIETLRNPRGPLRTLFLVLLPLVFVAGILLDVNTYSMHSMYRNRLIRAYLGASRWRRRPNAFTGFDPQDDLQMHQLRPELLWGCSFTNFRCFLEELKKKHDQLPAETDARAKAAKSDLLSNLPPRVVEDTLEFLKGPDEADPIDLTPIVIGAINHLMNETDFDEGFSAAVPCPALLLKNRQWLEASFKSIKSVGLKPPLHLLNIALNLVSGDRLAWQQRKAESFTVTPLHAGSQRLGYRDSRDYGGEGGMTLGTATAISGAAVSPNMGYHSSGAVTALLTMFNARLGWWLGNPGPIGKETFTKAGPEHAHAALFREATGLTNDRSAWVFLSDGGHFENLGLYEMVLRRCRYIIVCDATTDDKYAFDDLGNAVRKIRIDLGIPIDFDAIQIEPSDPKNPGAAQIRRYCAIGNIRYSAVDDPSRSTGSRKDPEDGLLLYIKPVVYEDCPVDIRNYGKTNPAFPHESTGDQFFSETQFESYRALGTHCIGQILGEGAENLSIETFFTAAETYVKTGAANRRKRRRAKSPTKIQLTAD
jgi:hypothetical protein